MAEKKTKTKLTSIKATKQPERKYLEDNEWYRATFEEVEVKEGLYGGYMLMKFKMLNGVNENGDRAKGMIMTALLNVELHPKSDLWKFMTVFLKKEPKIDEDYDITAYYGQKFRVLPDSNIPKKGKNAGNRMQGIKAIKRVLPAKKK